MHISRAWDIHDPFVDECPCERAACGAAIPTAGCKQHGLRFSKTIRNGHRAEDCSG